MSHTTKNNMTFIKKRRNTIVMLAIVFTVLIAGYFALRGVLVDETPVTTEPPAVELMPGESVYGDSTLIFDRIERKDILTIKVHNPANETYGEQYVDWGIGFAYNEEAEDYYGYMLTYEYAELDDTQLAYFVAAAGYLTFSDRVAVIDDTTDLAFYGLGEDTAVRMTVEKRNGGTHLVALGKKAANGGYYVRSLDTYVDEDGNTVTRNIIYLLSLSTSTYLESTVMAKPTEMLTTRVSYPVKSMYSSFVLQDSWGDLTIAFLPVSSVKSVNTVFGGSSLYYTVVPQGYFSSSEFETRISVFEDFLGDETLEYATKKVEGVDEKTGESYSYFTFDEETLAKYHLDSASELRMLHYTAAVEGSEEHAASDIYFSALQPGGFYYAYALNYGTIVQVSADQIDFLEWGLLDFVDAYALRISIGYCDTLTVKGTLDGKPYSESFISSVSTDYLLTSVKAASTNQTVDVELYRALFQVFYTTHLRGSVPEELDKEELMKSVPYAEITLKTRDVTVYATDELGMPTSKVEGVVKSVTRILRFYRYSNERTLMTVETIDSDGKSSGESGDFYVLTSRLDKIIRNSDMVLKGESFSMYEKE